MSDTTLTEPLDTLGGDATIVLPEFDTPPADPIALLQSWLADADARGVREPRALALATAAPGAGPSSRTVLAKALDDRGLVFTTHRDSRKGRDVEVLPRAAGTLYWRETLQQVNVEGTVEPLTDAESDALFAERPRAAQVTAAVSRQSQTLDDEDALRNAAEELLAGGQTVARPAGWGGYRLVFDRIEFWQGRPDRLHRRLDYRHDEAGWRAARLQP